MARSACWERRGELSADKSAWITERLTQRFTQRFTQQREIISLAKSYVFSVEPFISITILWFTPQDYIPISVIYHVLQHDIKTFLEKHFSKTSTPTSHLF